jgi:hypothetical protein
MNDCRSYLPTPKNASPVADANTGTSLQQQRGDVELVFLRSEVQRRATSLYELSALKTSDIQSTAHFCLRLPVRSAIQQQRGDVKLA